MLVKIHQRKTSVRSEQGPLSLRDALIQSMQLGEHTFIFRFTKTKLKLPDLAWIHSLKHSSVLVAIHICPWDEKCVASADLNQGH